jgi:hypothetical protein
MNMKKHASKIHSFICFLLTIAILLTGTAIPVFSQQEKPIVISFGQPNIWSLEQAHYLLARMHRQNLDLQTAALGDLDPNAANASRIEILKTLIEAGVKFDDAARINNELLRSDKTFNSQRRQELLTRRSSLQAESTQLAREIAQLKSAKAAAETDEERASVQAEIDAKTEQKAAVDNEITQTSGELQGLTSASGNFTSVEPTQSFNSESLKGDLDEIIKKVPLISPTIAATLRLDNHIQMQYEIIAKQLTLLRDEVGPGERLVFLELPQSISTTQDRAENRIAQAWWRIAGYTRVNKDELLEKDLKELKEQIEKLHTHVDMNEKLYLENQKLKDELLRQLERLCAEKARRELEPEYKSCTKIPFNLEPLENEIKEIREQIQNSQNQDDLAKLTIRLNALCAERDAQKNKQARESCLKIVQDIKQLDDAIRETKEAIQKVDDQRIKLQEGKARLAQNFTALTTKYEKLKLEQVRNKIREQQNTVDRLLQGGRASTSDIVSNTIEMLNQKRIGNQPGAFRKPAYGNTTNDKGQEVTITDGKGREYVNLDQYSASSDIDQQTLRQGQPLNDNVPLMRNRSIRTIDIIPRQSAVNVNDTKERVSKTGIFAAVSFLFGFGGKFGYQRQREQAEQFLNQELFTSGFGKGETDFGWSFYPFAGTKQLAPGIRTTYAIAIIPEDAESIVLKARGCYFPRKENQPLNYDMAGSAEWVDPRKEKTRNCTAQEQAFVLPVPGGSGDGADFYVTEMRYSPNRKPGERIVVSVQGQNLPTQLGVLVNGVDLRQSVGLAQSAIESILGDKVRENCSGQICGRFERIGPNQVVISFSMPPEFKTTPRIALIGPSREIELNRLYLNVNGVEDIQLDSSPWMFGTPPGEATLSIADFKVAPAPGGMMTGVLSGSKFNKTDTIYVNGTVAKASGISCVRSDLCILTFPGQDTDFLTVTISPVEENQGAVSRTFVNPTTLSIISASIVSSEEGEKGDPAVLTVKLDGSGFRNALKVKINDVLLPDSQKLVTSAGQMILKIKAPDPVVQISLTDPDNNKSVSTLVVTPPAQPKGKEK